MRVPAPSFQLVTGFGSPLKAAQGSLIARATGAQTGAHGRPGEPGELVGDEHAQLAIVALSQLGTPLEAAAERRVGAPSDSRAPREPFSALQGALLGVVGLILAFGLT